MTELLEYLRSLGFVLDFVQTDGNVHRFGHDAKKSKWYICFSNFTRSAGEQFYVCVFGDWGTGETHTFNSNSQSMGPDDRKIIKKQIEEGKKRHEEERKRNWEEVRREVNERWNGIQSVGVSAYLERKAVSGFGIRYDGSCVYVPVRDSEGNIWSLQKISEDGTKLFHPGGKVQGCFHRIEGIGTTYYVVEGYATGATVHAATGATVFVAFNAGNLKNVSIEARKFGEVVVAGDDDHEKTPNIGRQKAQEAAKAVGGQAIFPSFKIGSGGTDWNDLQREEGIEKVREQLVSKTVAKVTEFDPLYVVEAEYPDEKPPKRFGTLTNVAEMLKRLGVNVRYNIISKAREYAIPGLVTSIDNRDNVNLAHIIDWCVRCRIPTDNLKSYLSAIADKNLYNPVATWIESEPWDGESRLKDFYETIHSPDPLKERFIHAWMIQAVAAAFSPDGISPAGVLVLQGEQYIGKTKWFKNLCPPELRADGAILRPDDKDSVYQVICKWLVELGELDATFKKSDIAQLKAFITKDCDVLRLPYALEKSHFARRTVFFASVNDDKFLSDPTGNRRYWTVQCSAIEYDHKINMQQLWAEFLTLWRGGEGYHLAHDEIMALNAHNENFEVKEPVQERTAKSIDWEYPYGSRWLTASEVCIEIGILCPSLKDIRSASKTLKKLCGKNVRVSRGYTEYLVPPKKQ
jgi:putative DNA primase/helicase